MTGILCIGEPAEIIGNYILPRKFNGNIGFSPNHSVMLNKKHIGKIKTYKFKGKKILLLIQFYEPMGEDVYWCDIKINTLFSQKTGEYFLLDYLIVDCVEIKQKVFDASEEHIDEI